MTVCRLYLPAEPQTKSQHPTLPIRDLIRSGREGFADPGSLPQLSAVRPTEFTLLLTAIFFFFLYSYFIYLFIYFWLCWVFGSREGLLQLRQAGATLHCGAGTALHRGAPAPHHRGPSRCGAQAPDAQAQQPWLTGPAAPRHVGSSQTRARTRVPCISRQILNHCATREAPTLLLINYGPKGLPWWRSGSESACQCRGHGFEPWSVKIPHATEQLSPCATTTEPVL